MNWDRMEGQWKQQRGKDMVYWGKTMNDKLAAALGKYEELVGGLQEKYGIAQEEAKQHVINFKKIVEQLKISNRKLIKLEKLLDKRKLNKETIKSPALIGKSSRSNPRLNLKRKGRAHKKG